MTRPSTATASATSSSAVRLWSTTPGPPTFKDYIYELLFELDDNEVE